MPPPAAAPPTPARPLRFWLAFVPAALVSLTAFGFFVIGLGDGSISSFNLALWLGLLALAAAVPAGGWWLQSRGRGGWAIAVLAVLALPGLLYALFIVLLLVTQPRWN